MLYVLCSHIPPFYESEYSVYLSDFIRYNNLYKKYLGRSLSECMKENIAC